MMWRRTGTLRDLRATSRRTLSTHPSTRRSSLVLAAALTTVALSTTAAAGLASGPATPPAVVAESASGLAATAAVHSAVQADPEVATAVQAATAALSEAQGVNESPVDQGARDQINQATAALRELVTAARAEPAEDTTATALVEAAAAERTGAASRAAERDAVPAEGQPAEGQPAEGQPAEGQPAEGQPAEGQPAEEPSDPAADVVDQLGEPLLDTVPVLEPVTLPDVEATDEAEAADEAAEAPEQGEPDAPSGTEENTGPGDEAADAIEAATAALQALLDAAPQAAVSVTPPPPPPPPAPSPEQIAAEQAAAAQAEAARMADLAARAASFGNGQIPGDVLCGLSFAGGEQLRCDAAAALERLNGAFAAKFGRNLSMVDSYRSFAEQVAVKRSRGYLAAVPGTSNHGWGQAVDLSGGLNSYGSAEYAWMRANAPSFGWDNPAWARPGGEKAEPWHWEYGTSY